MKQLYILLISGIFGCSFSATAQAPVFQQENGLTVIKYRIFQWMVYNPPYNNHEFESTYVIKGDTLINSINHNFLYKDTVDNDTVYAKDLVLKGYISKDTGAISLLDLTGSYKKLFDFNAAPGDTVNWVLYNAVLQNIGSWVYKGITHPLYQVNPGLSLPVYNYVEAYGHLDGQGILTDDLDYIPIGIHQVFDMVTFNSEIFRGGHIPDYIDSSLYPLSVPQVQALYRNKITLYPNPAYDHISIQTNADLSPQSFILIADVHGKTVLRSGLSGQVTKLNISELSPGTYNYTIGQENNKWLTGTFIKQ